MEKKTKNKLSIEAGILAIYNQKQKKKIENFYYPSNHPHTLAGHKHMWKELTRERLLFQFHFPADSETTEFRVAPNKWSVIAEENLSATSKYTLLSCTLNGTWLL